jgi:hypothetical protein
VPVHITSKEIMASLKVNTMNFFENREELAEYVRNQLQFLTNDLQLTITIKPVRSEGYSVHTVIDT